MGAGLQVPNSLFLNHLLEQSFHHVHRVQAVFPQNYLVTPSVQHCKFHIEPNTSCIAPSLEGKPFDDIQPHLVDHDHHNTDLSYMKENEILLYASNPVQW